MENTLLALFSYVLFVAMLMLIPHLYDLWVRKEREKDELYEELSHYIDAIQEKSDKLLRKKLLRVYFENKKYRDEAIMNRQIELEKLEKYKEYRRKAYPYEKAIFEAYGHYASIGYSLNYFCGQKLCDEVIINSLKKYNIENPIETLELLRSIDVIGKRNTLGATLTKYGKCIQLIDLDFNQYVLSKGYTYQTGWVSLYSFKFSRLYAFNKTDITNNIKEIEENIRQGKFNELFIFKCMPGTYNKADLALNNISPNISYGFEDDLMYIDTREKYSDNDYQRVYTSIKKNSLEDVYSYLFEIRLTHHIERYCGRDIITKNYD